MAAPLAGPSQTRPPRLELTYSLVEYFTQNQRGDEANRVLVGVGIVSNNSMMNSTIVIIIIRATSNGIPLWCLWNYTVITPPPPPKPYSNYEGPYVTVFGSTRERPFGKYSVLESRCAPSRLEVQSLLRLLDS